jgi:transposase
MSDRRCKLGLRARLEIVAAVADGASQRSIARRYGLSPATVNTLWRRWREASADERVDGRCSEARRPVPKSCPWALSDAEQQRILTARAKTNWGPMRLAALVGRHRATSGRCSSATASHGDARYASAMPSRVVTSIISPCIALSSRVGTVAHRPRHQRQVTR